MVRLGI